MHFLCGGITLSTRQSFLELPFPFLHDVVRYGALFRYCKWNSLPQSDLREVHIHSGTHIKTEVIKNLLHFLFNCIIDADVKSGHEDVVRMYTLYSQYGYIVNNQYSKCSACKQFVVHRSPKGSC